MNKLTKIALVAGSGIAALCYVAVAAVVIGVNTQANPIEQPTQISQPVNSIDRHSATHEYYQLIKDLPTAQLETLADEYPAIDLTTMMSKDDLAYAIAEARTNKLINAGKL